MRHGFTFSQKYARQLGFEPIKLFTKILSELDFHSVRLCAYWDLVQPEVDNWDFKELDELVKIASQNKLDITIALGQKVPRWPEYHIPDWAKELNDQDFQQALQKYIRQIVIRYDSESCVKSFQVENEPLLNFGIFSRKALSKKDLVSEIEVARGLTAKPISTTASADLQDWGENAELVDRLGVNLYTKTYLDLKVGGRYVEKGVKVEEYKEKLQSCDGEVFVAELQAEAWGPGDIRDLGEKEEWEITMNPGRLRRNYDLAKNIGFGEVWFWGVEWWYYLAKEYKSRSILKAGKELIN